MTQRERFLALVRGERPDRMPFWYGGPRTSTMAAWRRQGLSEEQERNWGVFVNEEGFRGIGKLDFEPLPRFEEMILEERGNERIWIDHYGVKRIDAIHQPTAGFATRRYLEFPVKDRATFEEYAKRYDPTSRERTEPVEGENERDTANPDGYRVYQGTVHWKDRVALCNEGDVPVSITIPGLWWTLRDWCGFEGLCMMCAEQPELVRDMMDFWTDFILAVVDEPMRHIRVDHIMMNEDMAYKTAAMLGPDMMRAYMLPNYERLMAFFKSRGVSSVMMDTDGHVSQVLDVFYPSGLEGTAPLEIASYNDPKVYLKKHPGITIFGGIDKRELTTTKEKTRAEVVKRYRAARSCLEGRPPASLLPPLHTSTPPHSEGLSAPDREPRTANRQPSVPSSLRPSVPSTFNFRPSTFIPTVDHGVPPDIPVRNFLYMVELIQGFAQGEDLETYEPPCRLEKELGPIEELFDPKAAYAAAYGADER